MRKLKNSICEAVICAALVALFLVVGAVESFNVGLLEGILAACACFGVMLIAGAICGRDKNG